MGNINLEDIKANKIFIVVALGLVGWFAYADFNGIAFWQSNGIEKNTEYSNNGGIHHSAYGARFYHK